MIGMRALLSKRCITVARRIILMQLGQLVGMSLEDLFLLVWVAALVWSLRVLATSAVSFGDVVLPELANAITLPLLMGHDGGLVLRSGVALFDHTVELGAVQI